MLVSQILYNTFFLIMKLNPQATLFAQILSQYYNNLKKNEPKLFGTCVNPKIHVSKCFVRNNFFLKNLSDVSFC